MARSVARRAGELLLALRRDSTAASENELRAEGDRRSHDLIVGELAAGLHVSRLDGSPLRYNQPNPWLPDLVTCRPDLAEAFLAVTRLIT